MNKKEEHPAFEKGFVSSFLVGEDGNVYEGRGWSKQGAHAPNFNSRSIGIAVIGNFMSEFPSSCPLPAITAYSVKCDFNDNLLPLAISNVALSILSSGVPQWQFLNDISIFFCRVSDKFDVSTKEILELKDELR